MREVNRSSAARTSPTRMEDASGAVETHFTRSDRYAAKPGIPLVSRRTTDTEAREPFFRGKRYESAGNESWLPHSHSTRRVLGAKPLHLTALNAGDHLMW